MEIWQDNDASLSGEFEKTQAEKHNVDFIKVSKALDEFLEKNCPDVKYLVLGEYHNDEKLHAEMLSHPYIISTLHKYNLTTTGIERPSALQPFFETAKNDGQTLDEFAQSVHEGLEKASANNRISLSGLKSQLEQDMQLMYAGNNLIYFDNPDYSLSMIPKRDIDKVEDCEFAASGEAKRAYLRGPRKNKGELTEKKVLSDSEDFIRFEKMYVGKELAKEGSRANKHFEEFKALRVNEKDEALRAEYIKENAIEGAVILTGHAHGFGFGDLDEKLGPSTVRLSVVPNMGAYIERSQMDYSSGNEAPEGYLILDEEKIISGEDAYKAAQDFEAKVNNALSGIEAPTTKTVIDNTQDIKPV